ncbi:MAG TPA: hypothetical protein VFH23_00605 [Jiangellaceae bacterium]|nr:hypothetical protein [Jiangellaceae bacterium]
MKSRGPAKAFTALLAVGTLVGTAIPAAAVDVRPFQPRFERRVNGDISIVNATSATATASRPAGSTLLFAGLYWGGPAGPARPTPRAVTLQVASAAPRTVAADVQASDPARGFGAVADVTAQFRGTGPFVDVTVVGTGGAPWSLVTAWSSPAEPLRDLRVVDGLAETTANEPTSVTVTGLSTPRRGPVETTVGVVAHGDDARAVIQVDAGDTSATIPIRAEDRERTLVAAVTTATEAAAVTDLGVSTALAPATAATGDIVEITVKVTNNGPDDQTGPAMLTVNPGNGLAADAVSLSVTAGACGLAGSRAVCAVDPLAAGRVAEMTFDARVEAERGSTITASARALVPTSDTDPVAGNDTGRAAVRLTAPVAGSVLDSDTQSQPQRGDDAPGRSYPNGPDS